METPETEAALLAERDCSTWPTVTAEQYSSKRREKSSRLMRYCLRLCSGTQPFKVSSSPATNERKSAAPDLVTLSSPACQACLGQRYFIRNEMRKVFPVPLVPLTARQRSFPTCAEQRN